MPTQKPSIHFHYMKKAPLSKRRQLKAFIEQVFKKEKMRLIELHYVFCSDDYLLNMNKEFLDHDFYTDILTFDLSSGVEAKGEVYISVDRVRENASNLKVGLSQELYRVIFHGVLHLCGYKDKNTKDIKLMRQKEDQYLAKFNKFLLKH